MTQRKGSLHHRGTPATLIDLLSAEQRWISYGVLIEMVEDRKGTAPGTTERALRRLVNAGRVQTRARVDGHGWEFFCDEWSPGAA